MLPLMLQKQENILLVFLWILGDMPLDAEAVKERGRTDSAQTSIRERLQEAASWEELTSLGKNRCCANSHLKA